MCTFTHFSVALAHSLTHPLTHLLNSLSLLIHSPFTHYSPRSPNLSPARPHPLPTHSIFQPAGFLRLLVRERVTIIKDDGVCGPHALGAGRFAQPLTSRNSNHHHPESVPPSERESLLLLDYGALPSATVLACYRTYSSIHDVPRQLDSPRPLDTVRWGLNHHILHRCCSCLRPDRSASPSVLCCEKALVERLTIQEPRVWPAT